MESAIIAIQKILKNILIHKSSRTLAFSRLELHKFMELLSSVLELFNPLENYLNNSVLLGMNF